MSYLADRVQETFTTTGTGDITLAGASAAYQPFSAAFTNNSPVSYIATSGTDWEVGVGIYTTSTNSISRITIRSSSNSNNAVNWAAGTKTIWNAPSGFQLQNLIQPKLSNSSGAIASDVNLNNVSNYFTGPIISAPASSGSVFVSGQVTVLDTAAANIYAKLWDGTTLIASAAVTVQSYQYLIIPLSGIILNPVGDLRISVRDSTNTTGKIMANATGLGKDSSICAMAIG